MYKVAVAYLVAGWALAQGLAQVLPVFSVPNWVIQLLVVLIILGLPIALGLAWAFELTPEGLKRTEDSRCDAGGDAKEEIRLDLCRRDRRRISIGLFFLGRYSAAPRKTQRSTLR